MTRVQIVEVGLRDGLQNEAVHLSQAQRFQFAKKLAQAGLTRIEAGAFVSPKWVPQMAGSSQLIEKLIRAQKQGRISSKVEWSGLVPNMVGYEAARKIQLKEIAVFGAVSNTFLKKNINSNQKEFFKKLSELSLTAKKDKIKVRGYVSTVFGCPYEGKISVSQAMKTIENFFKMGVYELSVGDTIGVATPRQVKLLLTEMRKSKFLSKTAMHFHDTRGTALANIATSLDFGIQVFDSSLGGLGGCPYAPGAAGNVATEDVVYLLEGMGFKTGLDLDKLIQTTEWMTKQLGRPLVSRLSLAGRSCIY